MIFFPCLFDIFVGVLRRVIGEGVRGLRGHFGQNGQMHFRIAEVLRRGFAELRRGWSLQGSFKRKSRCRHKSDDQASSHSLGLHPSEMEVSTSDV